MAGGLRYVGPLLVGILIGFMAGRTLSQGASESQPQVACPRPTSIPAPVPAVAPAQLPAPHPAPSSVFVPSLSEQLAKLKISEVRDICDEVERSFQKTAIDSHAIALNDMPKNARDQEQAALARLFAATGEKDMFWRADFSIEAGSDVLAFQILLDLESNSEGGSQCAAWTVFYELNGRTFPDSLLGASACDGNGYRKKDNDFFVDLTLYNIPSLGRHVTSLLMPFPGGGGRPEYLDAEGKNWRPLPQATWMPSSRAEFLVRHKKFQEKLGGVSETR